MAESQALSRYLEQARIEELAKDLEAKGYRVSRDVRVGDLVADLVAERGEERLIIEVKTGETLRQGVEQIRQLARLAAEQPNTTFRLSVANPPRAKSIEIANLGDVLFGYLVNQATPEELDGLSSHTQVEGVADVEVLHTEVSLDEIHVVGSAVVKVRLQYGSDGDVTRGNGLVDHDAFPLEFDVTLNHALQLVRVNRLAVDTSTFYE
ncbi:MAG: hypothetical protein HPY83_03200 [Anaerolineae bacterium]|nr:hypothetical protein [Anaerolineae bacterium]